MEIDKQRFERHVPAFKDAGDRLFAKMADSLARCSRELDELTGRAPLSAPQEEMAAWHVCARAAYEAAPQLDLVLTPTGFGVVSNQNTAPASRDRVAALRERLRQEKSSARDQLLYSLLRESDWGETEAAANAVGGLLWCPMLCRQLGVPGPAEATVYDEEFDRLRPALDDAENAVRKLISGALYERLTAECRRRSPSRGYAGLVAPTRRLMAHLLRRSPHAAVRRAASALLEAVRAGNFEEYENSSTAAAQRAQPYRNAKSDPTYFWG